MAKRKNEEAVVAVEVLFPDKRYYRNDAEYIKEIDRYQEVLMSEEFTTVIKLSNGYLIPPRDINTYVAFCFMLEEQAENLCKILRNNKMNHGIGEAYIPKHIYKRVFGC